MPASRFPGCACYWLEPNGRYRIGLRRFTFASAATCPASSSGHDAERITTLERPVRYRRHGDDGMRVLAGVPRSAVPGHRSKAWPSACDACGEPFPRGAEWQAFEAIGYVRSDTGKTIWVRHVHGIELAGALYDAPWLHEYERLWDGKRFVGEDGIALVAVCPSGQPWQVDGEATGGGHWTRTGDPRQPETLTVSPSIAAGDQTQPTSYHGFLQGGHFTDDLGG